ncbi:MAG: EI24 domain-containing protein, partial [Planctomycetota bacterium]
MNLFKGIVYNLRGVKLSLKTPRLLILGLTRLVVVVFITILSASLILLYHQEILNLIWSKPESQLI